MRIEKAMLVFKKDWCEIRRNWQVILPIVIVPLLISVLLPVILTAIPSLTTREAPAGEFEALIQNLPIHVQEQIAGMTETQIVIYIMALYFLAPFFLIIPLMVSGVIASDSFAGEKERKTIEALLAAPFTDSELLMGKILVGFAPAMGVTLLSFALYTAMVDALTFGRFGFLLLPNLTWIVMILFLAPAASLLGIGATVIISSRVNGFREAQQLSALLVVPVLVLLFGQAAGFLIMGPGTLLALTVLVLVVDAALFGVGVSLFNRERILSQSH